jgi:F-type H+-transporting ATPase subunit a
MPEQLWFTAILNHLLASPVTGVLRLLGIQPEYPEAPITNAVAMEFLVFALLLVFFLLLRSRLSVERPGALQHSLEGIQEFVEDQAHDIIGHHSERFTPFLMSLGLFILICNLIGLVPGFESPTGVSATVPLGCAVVAFVYYHIQGIRQQGLGGYALHFFGPPMQGMSVFMRIPLAILMLPIEIASHLARLLSLTVRLWANIFAGDLITLVFFSMIPIGVPVIFNVLHVIVAILQAYVFVLLTMIYISAAVAEEH